jgi:ABC-2 type transport system ATP-binding protein
LDKSAIYESAPGDLCLNIIEVKDLSKRFGQLTAVDKVTFQVFEGEIFGFLGPNGAGKTTTISMLCTLLKPTGGSAMLCGHNVCTERSQVRHCIGLVFQDPTLDEYLTAEQNLRFHAYAYNVPGSIREERISTVLDLVELAERRKHKVSTFSGGMKRRLEIARGLLHNPKVLFLDEPTLGLDPQTRRHIWDYILELRNKEKLMIFLTTHYMDEAENCDRIAVVDHGSIVAIDTPDNLKDGVGGDMVVLKAEDNQSASVELSEKYGVTPEVQDGSISFTIPHGEEFLAGLTRGFDSRLLSISIRRPTLEDVFLKLTGREIRDQEAGGMDFARQIMRRG